MQQTKSPIIFTKGEGDAWMEKKMEDGIKFITTGFQSTFVVELSSSE